MPSAVLLVVCAASLFLTSRWLRTVEEQRVRQVLALDVVHAAERFDALLDDRLKALERMASRWRSLPKGGEGAWEEDARLTMSHMPGFAALAISDEAHIVTHTVPELPHVEGRSLTFEKVRHEAAQRARATGRPAIAEPIRLRTSGGGVGFGVMVPLERAGAPDGFLAAAFSYDTTLARSFGDSFARTFAYRVDAIDETLAAHALSGTDARFEVATPLSIGGRTQRLVAWPRADYVDELRDSKVVAVSLAQVVASVLVAFSWTMLRRARRTARRLGRSEALLRGVVDATDRSLIATDVDGAITLVNPTAERWLGWTAAELVGRATPQLIHVPEEMTRRAQALTIERGRPLPHRFAALVGDASEGRVETREWTYVRRDGSRFPVSLSVAPLRDPDGQPSGYLGVADDRTQERAAQAALERARDEAEEATRSKGEFLARMSHEIRTPLNGVLGMLELALDAPMPDAQRDQLRTAESSARHMLELVNDLLDFERIEAGGVVLDPQPINVRAWLRALVVPLALRARAKDVELVVDVDDSVPDEVRADGHRLRQVLVNLTGNALKFTDAGEVVLSVRAERAGETTRLVVAVRDTGIGIAPDQLARVFEPFAQAEASISRRFGGTGLGLTISRELATVLGGAIEVESEVGRGSTFTLRVPVTVLGEVRMPRHALEAGALVVARNDALRTQLAAGLERWSMSVASGPDGETALAALSAAGPSRSPVALVVAETHLLGHDPSRFATRLAAEVAPGCALILLGTEPPVTRLPAFEGRFAQLAKPVTASDLFDALETLRQHEAPGGGRAGGAAPKWPSVRVLLVEDNVVNRRVATGLLGRTGCEVVEAEHGAAALRQLERTRFDVVLMDVQMPVLDGLSATRQWRALERAKGLSRVPVVALTAQAMPGDRERCLAAGMDDFVSKPFDAAALFATIGRLLPASGGSRTSAPPARPAPDSGISRETLLERVGGDPELAAEVVSLLRTELPTLRGAVERSVTEGDADAIERASHKLAGALLVVGAERAITVARRLEAASRARRVEGAADELAQLDVELVAIERSLAEYRS